MKGAKKLKRFHKKLRDLVEECYKGNWSSMGRACGISPTSLQRLKEGGFPRLETLLKLSHGLKIDIDSLCTEEALGEGGETVRIKRFGSKEQFYGFSRSWLIARGLLDCPLCVAEIGEDDSLLPEFQRGDLCLLQVGDKDLKSGSLYGLFIEGEVLLRYGSHFPDGYLFHGSRIEKGYYKLGEQGFSQQSIIGRLVGCLKTYN